MTELNITTELGVVTFHADEDSITGNLEFHGRVVEVTQWDTLSNTPMLQSVLDSITRINETCHREILSNFNDVKEEYGVRMLLDHHQLPTIDLDKWRLLGKFQLASINIWTQNEYEPLVVDYRLVNIETNYLIAVTLNSSHKVVSLSIES